MAPSSTCSSPDPLALSYDENSLSPSKAARRRSAVPFSKISANAQAQHDVLRTPTKPRNSEDAASERSVKSIIMQTPNGGGSPWKIRVTVEAEPEQQKGGNKDGSIKRPNIRTRTITVPLRGPDDGSPVRKRRRKGANGDSPGWNKKNLTPMIRRERKSMFAALEGNSKQIGADSDLSTTRAQTTRSKSLGGDTFGVMDSPIGLDSHEEEQIIKIDNVTTRKRGRPRKNISDSPQHRAKTTPAPTAPASQPLTFVNYTPLHMKPEAVKIESEQNSTPGFLAKDTSLKSTKGRKGTPVKPKGFRIDDLSPIAPTSPDVYEQRDDEKMWRGMAQCEDKLMDEEKSDAGTASSDDQDDEANENGDVHLAGMEDDTNILDRSALESEGFSMISIDSLRSQLPADSLFVGSPPRPDADSHSNKSSLYATNVKEESVVDVTGAKSPQRHQPQRTPSAQVLPPQQPPIIPRSSAKSSPRKMSPTVQAGAALQNVVGTEADNIHSNARHSSPTAPHQVHEADNVFDGFGNITRRNLRAGLMMGELLSRSEPGFAVEVAAANRQSHTETNPARRSDSTAAVDYPRLPTPSDSEDSVHSAAVKYPDLHASAEGTQITDPIGFTEEMNWQPSTPPQEAAPDSPELTRTQKVELEWQREREAVVREAQAASPRRVIVINSSMVQDDRDMTENIEDIWQDEAHRSLEESKLGSEESEVENKSSNDTSQFEDLFEPELRPMRGKIPSPWRKNTRNDLIYSDEAYEGQSEHDFKISAAMQQHANQADADAIDPGVGGDDSLNSLDDDVENADDTGMLWLRSDRDSHRAHHATDDNAINLSDLLSAPKPMQSSPVKPGNTPRRNVLSSSLGVSPTRSSPSKVHFDEEPTCYSADATFLGEQMDMDQHQSVGTDSQIDQTDVTPSDVRQLKNEMGGELEVEQTDITPSDVRQLRNEMEADSDTETEVASSDVHQLREELAAMSTPSQKTIKFMSPSANPSFVSQNTQDSQSILAPKREYPSLFSEAPKPASQPAAKPPIDAAPPQPSISLFTRLTSFFTARPQPPAKIVEWSHAHYKLLNRIWRSSPIAPTRKCRRAELTQSYPYPHQLEAHRLPPAMQKLVGAPFRYDGWEFEMGEAEMRVAQVFIEDVAGRGAGEGVKDGIQGVECWEGDGREKQVAIRVFSLLVGEEMRREEDEAIAKRAAKRAAAAKKKEAQEVEMCQV